MKGGRRPPEPTPPDFPEDLPIWNLSEDAGLVIADFDIRGLYGVLMKIDDQIHNVFLGAAHADNRIVFDKESDSFVVIFAGDVRDDFRTITGSDIPNGTGFVLETLPTKDDISYRAVPSE